ncbi:hypothetical protein Leryth_024260 [Lithospermum erythrorhizon]|nr:hypothetical protein Leryth_024260 [Lithospermum erythrorhizon]
MFSCRSKCFRGQAQCGGRGGGRVGRGCGKWRPVTHTIPNLCTSSSNSLILQDKSISVYSSEDLNYLEVELGGVVLRFVHVN